VLAHRRTFLADVWNRGGGWRIAVLVMNTLNVCMEKFAPTNLINTNKPKERPSSLANGIRQGDAWKRRDGSCWPVADPYWFGPDLVR
jgi:hypothetical protein